MKVVRATDKEIRLKVRNKGHKVYFMDVNHIKVKKKVGDQWETIRNKDRKSQLMIKGFASTTKIKSLIHSRRIIVSDTRKKIDGVAVATARFSDAVAGQLGK